VISSVCLQRLINDLAPIAVDPAKELVGTVLAVSYGKVEAVLESNLAGFVWVKQVDEDKGQNKTKVHMLVPCKGQLPNTVFLVSDIQYLEN
jgi:hypothetical protein